MDCGSEALSLATKGHTSWLEWQNVSNILKKTDFHLLKKPERAYLNSLSLLFAKCFFFFFFVGNRNMAPTRGAHSISPSPHKQRMLIRGPAGNSSPFVLDHGWRVKVEVHRLMWCFLKIKTTVDWITRPWRQTNHSQKLALNWPHLFYFYCTGLWKVFHAYNIITIANCEIKTA